MARESSLWRWLAAHARKIQGLDLRRVENLLENGTPDVEGCWRGAAFQLELKSETRPARGTTPIRFKIRDAQVLWLRRRWRCGGSCWWYVQVGEGALALRYLIPGNLGLELLDGVSEQRLADLSVIPGDHDLHLALVAIANRCQAALED